MPSPSDPLDEAFPGQSVVSALSSADPIEQAFSSQGESSYQPTIAESVTGYGERTLRGVTGALASVPAGVAYLGTGGNKEFAKEVQNRWTYEPTTEAAKQQDVEQAKASANLGSTLAERILPKAGLAIDPSGNLNATAQDISERAQIASGALPAAGLVARLARGGSVANAIEQGHPLTEAAQAEVDRMQGHIAAAKAQGLDLAPREVSPAQVYVDNAARRDVALPKNSPVTSGILDAAIEKNALPSFKAVRSEGAYPLGPKYKSAIGNVDLSKIDPDVHPPTEGSIDGDSTVDLSQELRDRARGLYEDASNQNLTSSQRRAAQSAAQAHYQAAKAIEAGFREYAESDGRGALADNWDNARVYVAKANTWKDALQGGVEGHVNGLKIRKLGLADEPITGPMQEAASVAAQHPDQFRSGVAVPTPGPVGRLAKKLAPVAGAAVGGAIAPGVVGPMVGAELAGSAADRLIR